MIYTQFILTHVYLQEVLLITFLHLFNKNTSIIPPSAPIAFFPTSIHEKCRPIIIGFEASSSQQSTNIKSTHQTGFSHNT